MSASEWVLDLRCTYHICSDEDLFSTYDPIDFGMVTMGNDAQCKVVETDTVQINTHDGCQNLNKSLACL